VVFHVHRAGNVNHKDESGVLAHRVRGRQVAVAQVAAHEAVGGGVHVYGKGGEAILLGVNLGVDAIVFKEHVGGFLRMQKKVAASNRYHLLEG
jgi:hypothetical protein